jgi:hypothetical protein
LDLPGDVSSLEPLVEMLLVSVFVNISRQSDEEIVELVRVSKEILRLLDALKRKSIMMGKFP